MDVTKFVALFQALIAVLVGYVVYLSRRDSKRSTQIAILSWLENHRKHNADSIVTLLKMLNSEKVSHDKKAREVAERDLSQARHRLKLLDHVSFQIIEQTDKELDLKGELIEIFKKELEVADNKMES